MDARKMAVAPLVAPLRGPARLGAALASLFFWLLALGALVGVGIAGPMSLAFLWIAGMGLLAVRFARRKLG